MPLSNRNDTVVLLFTRSATEESSCRDFLEQQHHRTNRRIATVLIDRSIKVIQQSELPFLIVDSAHQTGNTFGERFANAFQSAFDLGYEKVIAVGSDVPGLKAATLHQAKRGLSTASVVLGPSLDGGAYLIGLHHNYFPSQQFSSLPWQTPEVLIALINLAAKMGATTRLLQAEIDIDRAHDLKVLLRLKSNESWLLSVISWIAGLAKHLHNDHHRAVVVSRLHTLHFRGPPVLAGC